MRRRAATAALATVLALPCAALAQTSPPAPSGKWEIVDNSFLVEEAFNQEANIFQNIFTWTRNRDGTWDASFTQEWPAPGVRHQLSYNLAFSADGGSHRVDDVVLNYRYQLFSEEGRHPAVSPRASLVLHTGREQDGVAGLQVNVPASRQFGDLYVHANAGWTWLPDVANTPHVAGSGIWRVAPMVNVLFESFVEFGESTTFSPGVRGGWNFGDRQLVLGAALPTTRADGRTTVAVLTYVSYELPFR